MDKKNSLEFLQKCADKIVNASAKDIKMFRMQYDIHCKKPFLQEYENVYLLVFCFLYMTDLNFYTQTYFPCMIIRKLIITRFLSFNIVVQYNSDTMDF